MWDIADKTGTVLTILGFVLAVFTLYLAGSISNSLRSKVRVPEAILDITNLLAEIRTTLKDWDNYERQTERDLAEIERCQQEVNIKFYQAVAHVQNIFPRLTSMQKKSAKEALGLVIQRTGYWWWAKDKYRVDSSKSAWDAHNMLHGFSAHLEGLVKDRAAGGI